MKRLNTSNNGRAAAAVLVALVLVTASATSVESTEPSKSPSASTDLYSRLDTNQDGKLVLSEIDDANQNLFKRLLRTSDKNKDSAIDQEEFAQGTQSRRATRPLEKKQSSEIPGAEKFKKVLAQLDANGDGRILRDEVPKKHTKIYEQFLERADLDKNGRITQQEINRAGPQLIRLVARNERTGGMPQRSRGGENLFRRWDANGDGKIVLEEVPRPRQQAFQNILRRADRNKDQSLNRREFLVAFGFMNRSATNGQADKMPAKNKANKNRAGKKTKGAKVQKQDGKN